MPRPKFINSAEQDDEPKIVYDRYGMSELEWRALTPEQRVMHYNRHEHKGKCEHVADLLAWPVELREQYSFDPYSHTPHLLPHRAKDPTCECQTCDLKIGVPRDGVKD